MVSQKVLVMVPAYNEEKTVGEVVKTTLALYSGFKVVVVDDGSEDATAQKAREAGADVISLPFHCGGSIAIQTGYLIAERQGYDYTVKIDADGQHRPEDIPSLLDPLINDGADMTMGSRYLKLNSENCSLVKESGRVFSSTLVSLLRKMEITDVTSGMRAWTRKAIETLLPMYMKRRYIEDSVFWVVETFLASKNGLRMREVPIDVLPRRYGKSKSYSLGKMVVYPLRLVIALLEQLKG